MNRQDKAFLTVAGAVLGALVALAGVIFIIAQLISGASMPEQDRTGRLQAQVEERIRPVGRVVIAGTEEAGAQSQTVAAADAEMTGEQVYNNACSACHAAGVLEAPVAGDNAAWSARYQEKGMDTLLDHAINGFNQMPARGGNADLGDRNVHDAIVYMLEKSEVEVAAADLPETDGSAATEESAEQAAEMASATDTGEPPTEEAADSAEQAGTETEASATAEPAEQAATETEASDAVETGEQAAEPETSDTDAEQAGLVVPDSYDPAQGEQTYNQVCMVCHAQGVAGAPKLGEQEAWAPRLGQGWDTLQQHTLQGFNAMPAKGGRPDLPDEQILNALAYMIGQAQ